MPMSNRAGGRYVLIGLLILVVIGALAYFLVYSRNTPPSAPASQDQQTTSSSSTGRDENDTTDVNTSYPVSIYFSKHPESDNDPSRTFPVKRTSPDAGVGRFAIAELLKQPSASEQSKGYFTTVKLRSGESTCNGADFTLGIENEVATLQFCKPFDHLGVMADGQAESEIKATLLQFPTVKKVIILNSRGDCEFNLSGQNLCRQ